MADDKTEESSGRDVGISFGKLQINNELSRFGFPVIGLAFSFALFTSSTLRTASAVGELTVNLVAMAIALVSMAAGFYAYLQAYRPPRTVATFGVDPLAKLSEEVARLERSQTQSSKIISVHEDERSKIIEGLRASLGEKLPEQLAAIWKGEFSEKQLELHRTNETVAAMRMVAPRLLAEVQSLNARGNVNLAVGSSISLIGLLVLSWFVWITSNELTAHVEITDVAMRFAVRFTLAAFIQIFAYFFLRLYRYSIFETKFFQNEATNAEFRLLSLMTAINTKDQKLIEKVCVELSKTERNFVLKKGETTVGIQRDQIERDYDTLLLKAAEAIVAREPKKTH